MQVLGLTLTWGLSTAKRFVSESFTVLEGA